MKKVTVIIITIMLVISLLPLAVFAAQPDEYTLFYKNEEGEWMIQLIPIENILMNPVARTSQFCDRLFRQEPDIDKMARYYTDNKVVQFLSKNKGLAASGVALAGVVYIYVSEQPTKDKKAGAAFKVLKQLRKIF